MAEGKKSVVKGNETMMKKEKMMEKKQMDAKMLRMRAMKMITEK